MNFSVLLFITGSMKILFNPMHLLVIFISLELLSLSLITMTWDINWSQTIWFMVISVIHSIMGMLVLLMVMRQMGNDKSLNIV